MHAAESTYSLDRQLIKVSGQHHRSYQVDYASTTKFLGNFKFVNNQSRIWPHIKEREEQGQYHERGTNVEGAGIIKEHKNFSIVMTGCWGIAPKIQ